MFVSGNAEAAAESVSEGRYLARSPTSAADVNGSTVTPFVTSVRYPAVTLGPFTRATESK
jgi:hypothetical protein